MIYITMSYKVNQYLSFQLAQSKKS
jgi:hypothetical protein